MTYVTKFTYALGRSFYGQLQNYNSRCCKCVGNLFSSTLSSPLIPTETTKNDNNINMVTSIGSCNDGRDRSSIIHIGESGYNSRCCKCAGNLFSSLSSTSRTTTIDFLLLNHQPQKQHDGKYRKM